MDDVIGNSSIMSQNDKDSNEESDIPDNVEQNKMENRSVKRKMSATNGLRKKRKTHHDKLLTHEELANLGKLHSRLFQMQCAEMKKEIKLKEKWKLEFQQWMQSFEQLLCNLPESEKYKIDDLSWLPKKVQIPICLEPSSVKGQFNFLPPTNVTEVGSYALGITCSKKVVIDIAVEIPKACWVKTDFLNHVYHRKRAMYLAYMVKFIKKGGIVKNMKFSFQHGDFMKPVLLLTPKGVCSKHFIVCLLPYPERSSFKLNRFIPSLNNVRPSWFFKEKNSSSEVPTPVYNSTILADILMTDLHNFLEEKISSANVRNGIVFLKVWCKQRGLDVGYRGFNGFIFTMIVAYLMSIKKILPVMSAYQVFRVTLLFIVQHKWFETAITLCKDSKENQPSVENFQEVFDVVFLDPSGFLNIFSHFEKETISRICHEAEITLKNLDSMLNESFGSTFIDKVPFCRKFDSLLQISSIVVPDEQEGLLFERNTLLSNGNNFVASIVLKLCNILRRGLGKRVTVLDIENNNSPKWSVTLPPPNPKEVSQITVGLLLDPEFAFNPLEKGPRGTDLEAKEFRDFWGDVSNLRRFKDGAIHEAVLFSAESIGEQRSVVVQMAKYILQRHCGIDPARVDFVGNNVDTILTLPKEMLPPDSPVGTGEELFSQFMQSFTTLCKELRNLEGLPLIISSIQGVSSAFRFSEVIPPFSTTHLVNKKACFVRHYSMIPKENSDITPSWVPPFKVVVHFEGSGKWPDDKEALKAVKASFHLEIAARVKSMLSLTAVPYFEYVNILKDGYVFQLEVACHKEITLLKQVISDTGVIQIKNTKEARELELATEILPKLNSILHGLHQQHNSFGTACRLAKRWIAAQLLGDYITDVTIELLVAYLYVNPAPYTQPSCPHVAFHRFLALLSTHDWKMAPLIINLNSELTAGDVAEIKKNFRNQRTVLPPMFIATSLDKSSSLWTREKPSHMILDRLLTLSEASLNVLESQIYDPSSSDFKLIFRPPLDVFDVMIHLNSVQIPKHLFCIDLPDNTKIAPIMKYQPKSSEILPVVGFDTVQMFVEHLRECFDEFAFFFHDTYGGEYIALLWKPDAFKPQPLKISNSNGRIPITDNDDGPVIVVPDVEAMLHYISTAGMGIVSSLERQMEKWTIS